MLASDGVFDVLSDQAQGFLQTGGLYFSAQMDNRITYDKMNDNIIH